MVLLSFQFLQDLFSELQNKGFKFMKFVDFLDMDVLKLEEKLLLFKREQFNLRFQKASGQLEKTSRIKEVRRDIARVKTLIRIKDIERKI